MEKAVDVAEKNMSRFGLSQAEISKRRKWVMQTRTKVQTLCGSGCTPDMHWQWFTAVTLACNVFTILRLQKLRRSAWMAAMQCPASRR